MCAQSRVAVLPLESAQGAPTGRETNQFDSRILAARGAPSVFDVAQKPRPGGSWSGEQRFPCCGNLESSACHTSEANKTMRFARVTDQKCFRDKLLSQSLDFIVFAFRLCSNNGEEN
jgi:hypothetical protein